MYIIVLPSNIVVVFLSFQDAVFNEIELTDLTLAECSIKNANHSFQVSKNNNIHCTEILR